MLPSGFNTRNPRPVSDILKTGNYTSSSENDSLNLWYEDLQQYERNLDEMAAASLDQNFKEEMQHVDQWFRFLSEAERTATIYTLLQHSSQVQVRFFINLLQQMGKRDSILMTPNPEQVDMQSQFAGALAKAEMEASQRLMSVLPYKTGQVVSRPPPSSARRQVDRHSFALGDTEDYSRQFLGNSSNSNATNNRFSEARLGGGGAGRPSSQTYAGTSLLAPGFQGGTSAGAGAGGRSSRPRSVIVEGDTSTLFSTPWTTPASTAPSSSRRPMSVVGSIGDRNSSGLGLERPKSADISNWSFGGMDTMVDHHQRNGFQSPWTLGLESDIDFNALTLQPYRRGNNTTIRGNNIPGTLAEKDEQQQPLKTPLSRPTSPRPATSSSTPFNHRKHLVPPGMEKQFGQFLNPSELDPVMANEHDYQSDHSEASNVSARRVSGAHPRPSMLSSTPLSSNNATKDKKAGEVIDMELLNDVPAWFRSLRLHKYNSIFEPMKWQDIIKLTDSDLEAKGVAALGARRKMLKIFENIRNHCKENNIDY